ncbi:uncharacterized protein LOC133800374 [Humulus lupulus]|uniref:uncharacterized protein LOC133800374 n=1 Tax=Humulus lupulus TaxID=3486 RepID=UPI002B417B47|nr:uncharacterized protein LOC133800374 [Humulus lupulus]
MLLNPQLKQKAEWYILNNCAEIKEYLSEHMDELRRRGGLNLEVQQKTDFPQWFKERVNGLHESTPTEVNNELYALANKSSGTVYSYPGMIVNGVKFVTRGRDMKLKTQNCGVMVPSEEGVNYYGTMKNSYYRRRKPPAIVGKAAGNTFPGGLHRQISVGKNRSIKAIIAGGTSLPPVIILLPADNYRRSPPVIIWSESRLTNYYRRFPPAIIRR